MARERPTPPLLQGHGRARRLNHQAVDDRDADGAKPGFASETEANLKRPIPNHGTKGSKGYLGVIRYSIVTCQFAIAGAVYGGDRRRTCKSISPRKRSARGQAGLFSPLSPSFGFTHRIAPET